VCLIDSENPTSMRVGNAGRCVENKTAVMPCIARCSGIAVIATQAGKQKMRLALLGLFDDEEDEEGC